jgi:hypothetical protein
MTSTTGFNAAEVVPDLDYDLTKFAGPKAKGTIPEPSREAIEKFEKAIKSHLPDGDTSKLGEMSEEEMAAAEAGILATLAELCSNQPTRAQLKKLPNRHLIAFIGWLVGMLRGPSLALLQGDTPKEG